MGSVMDSLGSVIVFEVMLCADEIGLMSGTDNADQIKEQTIIIDYNEKTTSLCKAGGF